ncbi:MAG: LytTR family DNA-binding domain-containing protein [Spirochaetales bacterium]|nr:LytTR family DNA-binding domain-containing protein [Spirochaetales bacterium]
MLEAVIVDDEKPARDRIREMLSTNKQLEIIGEAEDGIMAVELIERLQPQLVLLDIQMPRLDGFGVIRALDNPPVIIFTTAYDQYAIKAFEVNAIDYLLKPFSRGRLETSIEKALQRLSEKSAESNNIEGLLKTLTEQKRYMERIAVKADGRIFVIDANQIDTIIAEDGLNFIIIGERRYNTNFTLAEFQKQLNPEIFFRAHRSAIVNLTRIKEIIPWFSGSYKVKLSTGAEVDLSRTQASELKKIIKW